MPNSCLAGFLSASLADEPPMTLGNAAAARVRLIVWCKECQHQVEPDPLDMAVRHGAETPVLDWREPADLFPLRKPGSGRRLIRAEAESSCEN